ncbi:MAG: D-alanyl-D-alanine carboxypeptidase/D-alanyl-D-alanine-endopeptidase [Acidobacteria bacterium]|nr:D-alanyl-D-alanine carboxypeptidase/D-alanyl-D-alanine-endopeptidase [Acidobacteriota bacterium]
MRLRNSALALALAGAGCAHPAPAASPARPAAPALPVRSTPAVATLRRDIDAVLAQPVLAHSYWGVLVKSLTNGETLYEWNADKLMMPASNMKIVTLAAAAETLGWDYRFATTIATAGSVENGTLHGDLVVVGSGDPSLVAADGMADRVFADWAAQLKQRGILAVSGRLIGDDNAFEKEPLGFGWMWDDLPTNDSAGVGALQYNENGVRVTVSPGPAAGDSAAIALSVGSSGLTIVNAVTTTAVGTAASISTRRLAGSMTLELRGSIALGASASTLLVSVDNPTQFFVNALRAALIANGIDVRGAAVDIDDLADAPATRAAPIVSYQSAPLSVLAVRLMKASQNQYAETFLKTVGAGPGVVPTAAGGWSAAQAIFERWGVPAGALIQRDGSGLTRYDFVTPGALVAILTHVDQDPRLKGPFAASLPIAGRDGTLSRRMKGTPAEGNVRAKTGSMTAVRGTSGYVTSADGEPLVFAILANNFDAPAATITAAEDAIIVRVAQFMR